MESKKNGSDKNVGSIENLIEQLTKVRPDELSKDGLKLFEYINEIIDRNQKLEEENKRLFKEIDYTSVYLKATFDEREKWTSKIKEKIEEISRKIKHEDNEKVIIWLHKQRKILQELLEVKANDR